MKLTSNTAAKIIKNTYTMEINLKISKTEAVLIGEIIALAGISMMDEMDTIRRQMAEGTLGSFDSEEEQKRIMDMLDEKTDQLRDLAIKIAKTLYCEEGRNCKTEKNYVS